MDNDPIKAILIRVDGMENYMWFYPDLVRAACQPWDVDHLGGEQLTLVRKKLEGLHWHLCTTASKVEQGRRNLHAVRPRARSNVDIYLHEGTAAYKRLLVQDLLVKCGAYTDLIEIIRRARTVR